MQTKPLILALLLLLATAGTVYSQKDTVFFDKDWNITRNRSEMQFYRLPAERIGNRWKITDMYRNGKPQMTGYFNIDDPTKLLNYASITSQIDRKYQDGEFTYYYETGKVDGKGVYKDGKKVGVWKYYYDTTGKPVAVHTYKDDGNERSSVFYYRSGHKKAEGKLVNDMRNGEWVFYYDSMDVVEQRCNYKDSLPHGPFKEYYKSGKLFSEGQYEMGERDGDWKYYRDTTGKLSSEMSYRSGVLHGELKMYHRNGKLKRQEEYFEDVMESGKCYNEKGEEVEYYPMKVMPEPPYDVWKYLKKNTRYPKQARKNEIEGVVNVKFVVDVDGKITDVISLSPKADKELVKEALRVVGAMDPWKPGRIDNEPVKIYYTVPVVFKLTDEGDTAEE